MTDGAGAAARAVATSSPTLRDRGLIDATITCGHAFGGDYEAVSVFSALAVARHVADADAAVVAMGPGIVGTNTRLGFSGMEVGPILDAAVALGGVPIACLRVSFADARDRHVGLSHHSAHRAAPRRPRPRAGRGAARSPTEQAAALRADLEAAGIDRRHDLVDVARARRARARSRARPARSCRWDVPRPDDPVLFQAAAAAGALAARPCTGPRGSGDG